MQLGLTDISFKYGTDKGPLEHGYTIVYDMLLSSMRASAINFLEIGLARGGPEVGSSPDRPVDDIPSIRMWHEFLPEAHLYGLDISDFSRFQTEWFTFFRGDCGNSAELRKVADAGIDFDVIIDDGSHASFHQRLTFLELFKRLKPGGLYIVEDLHWQPTEYERSLPATPKMAKILFDLADQGRSEYVPDEIAQEISSVLIFDEDELVRLRKWRNLRTGIQPHAKRHADGTLRGLPMLRSRLRRIAESIQATLDISIGRRRVPHRAKLAVIHKSMVPLSVSA